MFTLLSVLNHIYREVPISKPKETPILPQEIWLHILGYLQAQDLCHVALVNCGFYNICCDPSLWRDAPINETKLVKDGIQKLISVKRFSKLKSLDLPSRWRLEPEQWEIVFTDLDKSLVNLESINLSKVDLEKVTPALLARVLCRLQKVDLDDACLLEEQCLEFLHCSIESTTLHDLTLQWFSTNANSVPPSIIGQAISRLNTVSLCGTQLTKEQFEAVLEAMLVSETLENVDLSYNNLSQVDSELLAKAVCRMVTVDLSDTELTKVQSTAILTKMLSSSSSSSNRLEEIDLDRAQLEDVPEELIAKAVASVKKVSLRNSALTAKQYSALFLQGLGSKTLESLRVTGITLSFDQAELADGLKEQIDIL